MVAQPVIIFDKVAEERGRIDASSVRSHAEGISASSFVVTDEHFYVTKVEARPRKYAIIKGKKNVSLAQETAWEGRTHAVSTTEPSIGKIQLSFAKSR